MEFKTVSRSVESVMKDVQKGKISLQLDIQRPVGAYSTFGKSMVIDSLLRSYPLGIIYIVVEENEEGKKVKYIVDGNQRIGNLRNFILKMDGIKNYKLSATLDPLTIDGVTYEIAGKKYDALDEEVKSALGDAALTICEISNYTREELNDFYIRINSGKALNPTQKLLPLMSNKMLNDIKELGESEFFEKALTKTQFINTTEISIVLEPQSSPNSISISASRTTEISIVLEALMLMEFGEDCGFESLRNTDKIKFVTKCNSTLNVENVIAVSDALDKLNEHYTKKVKMSKTILSLAIYGVCKAQIEGKDLTKYFEWLDNFIATYKEDEEFMQFCKQGTANAANVKGRLDYFNNIIEQL